MLTLSLASTRTVIRAYPPLLPPISPGVKVRRLHFPLPLRRAPGRRGHSGCERLGGHRGKNHPRRQVGAEIPGPYANETGETNIDGE